MVTCPDADDIVVRKKQANPTVVYVLGTPAAPTQLQVRVRDEAVSQALAFAKRQQVRAWFADGNDFELLGTFRSGENPRGDRDGKESKNG